MRLTDHGDLDPAVEKRLEIDDAMSIMDAALVIAACTLALAGIASFVYVLHLLARIT